MRHACMAARTWTWNLCMYMDMWMIMCMCPVNSSTLGWMKTSPCLPQPRSAVMLWSRTAVPHRWRGSPHFTKGAFVHAMAARAVCAHRFGTPTMGASTARAPPTTHCVAARARGSKVECTCVLPSAVATSRLSCAASGLMRFIMRRTGTRSCRTWRATPTSTTTQRPRSALGGRVSAQRSRLVGTMACRRHST